MQNRPPDGNLILEAEGGRASRSALLNRDVAMLIGSPACYELDQCLRLVGKAIRGDFDGAQQLVTLQHCTVVISYVEPERPIEQGSKAFGGKRPQPVTGAAIGDDWNDNVRFAGVAENLRNALSRKAIVAGKHHDVGGGCNARPSLVGTAETEIGGVVQDTDAGVGDRQ